MSFIPCALLLYGCKPLAQGVYFKTLNIFLEGKVSLVRFWGKDISCRKAKAAQKFLKNSLKQQTQSRVKRLCLLACWCLRGRLLQNHDDFWFWNKEHMAAFARWSGFKAQEGKQSSRASRSPPKKWEQPGGIYKRGFVRVHPYIIKFYQSINKIHALLSSEGSKNRKAGTPHLKVVPAILKIHVKIFSRNIFKINLCGVR